METGAFLLRVGVARDDLGFAQDSSLRIARDWRSPCHAHPMVAFESIKGCPQTIAHLPVDGEQEDEGSTGGCRFTWRHGDLRLWTNAGWHGFKAAPARR